MFNLEHAIKSWRRQMIDAGIKSAAVLDELENHLREDVERRINCGLEPSKAFESSARRLGEATVLKNEFAAVSRANEMSERIRHFIRVLCGVSNPLLVTNMNTQNTHIESAWATYLKGAGFLLPAVCLWIFSVWW